MIPLRRAVRIAVSQMGAPGADNIARLTQIARAWPNIARSPLSRVTRPERLIGAELEIVAVNHSWATAARYQKDLIVERINQTIHEAKIAKIWIRVDPTIAEDDRILEPVEPTGEASREAVAFADSCAASIKNRELADALKEAILKADRRERLNPIRLERRLDGVDD